jgi:DNA-binding CsgD family transcriptional regulator
LVTPDKLSRLLLLLYEGVSSPEAMQAFLSELIQAVDAKGAVLREHAFAVEDALRIQASSLTETVGYPPEALRLYREQIWEKDVYVQRAFERFRDVDCGVSQALISEAERRRTELYGEYQARFDFGPMMWVKLAGRSDYHASISIARHDGATFFGEPELQILTALAPHLRQALCLSKVISDLQTTNAVLGKGLDEAGIAICMIRQDGSVLRSTEGASRILERHDGIWLRHGRLETSAKAEQHCLDALITAACQTGSGRGMDNAVQKRSSAPGKSTVSTWTAGAGGAMLITRTACARPLQVVVSPFCAGLLLNETEATALVHLSDPSTAPQPRASVLRALYGLSPTESRLADLLLQGCEVREAADRLKLTLETTRFHLKQTFAKTGTHRQSELLRLMLSLPGST